VRSSPSSQESAEGLGMQWDGLLCSDHVNARLTSCYLEDCKVSESQVVAVCLSSGKHFCVPVQFVWRWTSEALCDVVQVIREGLTLARLSALESDLQ